MSSERRLDEGGASPPLPQDEFAETSLVAELEPSADGGKRALLYPAEETGPEVATRWLSVPADSLVDLESVR
ncbi:DUF7511 domain-containing protein [Haloarcula nitratireducens]|uniref:DUF7511 domain-containing protein n=1 Tax=Haloarcula nitratireducens TaxID=2487749 RepID=A0AAW4PD38_9EURY|nr:hypothetical protein [Halomicroarcula nitratireducens]MBX0295800.1 hypothetical protein [Halomicroarcula nitratireducens]